MSGRDTYDDQDPSREPAGSNARDPSAPALGAASDEALIALVARDQDRAAFKEIFERYGGRLKGFMLRSGASEDEAEEAAQEALLAVWRRAETFDPARASAAAWLFTVARNKRVDLLRRRARPEPDPDDVSMRPDPPRRPDADLAARRRDDRVRAVIATLTDEQRAVIALSFFEGRPHSEIAESLGVPLGTVKSRLRLAFQKLRDALGGEFREELRDD